MFFWKPQCLVLLDRNRLTITDGNEGNKLTITIPSTSLNFLEVIDPPSMLFEIKRALTSFSRQKQRAIVFLGNDMVFSAIIQSTDTVGEKKETAFFFYNLPLTAKNIAGKMPRAARTKRLFATNRAVLSVVSQACREIGWKIQAIVPSSLFLGSVPKQSLSNKDIRAVFSQRRLLHWADFTESISLGK